MEQDTPSKPGPPPGSAGAPEVADLTDPPVPPGAQTPGAAAPQQDSPTQAAAAETVAPVSAEIPKSAHQMEPPVGIGRIVHYVMPHNGKHRPAIVTERHGDTSSVNLSVFVDSSDGRGNFAHETNVFQAAPDPTGKYPPHSWHWPERD